MIIVFYMFYVFEIEISYYE